MVELERSVYTVLESDGFTEICTVVRTNGTDSPVGFSFNVSISLKDSNEGIIMDIMFYSSSSLLCCSIDIKFVSHLVIFSPFEKKACTGFSIRDDNIAERNQILEIVLIKSPDLDRRIGVGPSVGELFLVDDDGRHS